MNLQTELTKNEINLLNKIGLNIENKDYNKEELRQYESYIEDYIMNHSSKNQDIQNLIIKYNNILERIINFIK